MTLTDNIRYIQDYAGDVIYLTDRREYEDAHCKLDDIEKKVRAVHRHIDNLQLKSDCAARPAGGD